MSSFSSKFEPVRTSGTGRAGAKLHHLKDRKGFVDTKEKRPRVVKIEAPSQTEWWVWVSGEDYELDRVVAEGSKSLLRKGSAE